MDDINEAERLCTVPRSLPSKKRAWDWNGSLSLQIQRAVCADIIEEWAILKNRFKNKDPLPRSLSFLILFHYLKTGFSPS